MAQQVSGSQVYGVDFPPSQYDQDWTNIPNVTTTSFTSESLYRGICSAGYTIATTYCYAGNFSLETGLTPGRQYYFQVMHRSIDGEGVGDIASRDITVIPVP